MTAAIPRSTPHTDRVAVQDALAELLVRLRRKELHYYNFIGNNNDSLMNVLGCSPIMYGAVMCTLRASWV